MKWPWSKTKKEEGIMQIQRIVKVNSFGVGGGCLAVTFKGVAYRPSGFLDSPSPSLKVGWSGMSGNDKEFCISSRYFPNAKEAAEWIEQLTNEVKEYASIDKQFLSEFSALEGEVFI